MPDRTIREVEDERMEGREPTCRPAHVATRHRLAPVAFERDLEPRSTTPPSQCPPHRGQRELAGVGVVSGAGVTVKGSIEYAVAELNVPLIVVLGHSGCGAVKAAMKHIDARDSLPGAINGLVELIKPAVTQTKGASGDAIENAIRKNVEIGVERLKDLQPILAPRVKDSKLKVVGALYDVRAGVVTMVELRSPG